MKIRNLNNTSKYISDDEDIKYKIEYSDSDLDIPVIEPKKFISLWRTNRDGSGFERIDLNFSKIKSYEDIDHGDYWTTEQCQTGFKGRFTDSKNTTTIYSPWDRATGDAISVEDLPNRLFKTLEHEYGKDVKMFYTNCNVWL